MGILDRILHEIPDDCLIIDNVMSLNERSSNGDKKDIEEEKK